MFRRCARCSIGPGRASKARQIVAGPAREPRTRRRVAEQRIDLAQERSLRRQDLSRRWRVGGNAGARRKMRGPHIARFAIVGHEAPFVARAHQHDRRRRGNGPDRRTVIDRFSLEAGVLMDAGGPGLRQRGRHGRQSGRDNGEDHAIQECLQPRTTAGGESSVGAGEGKPSSLAAFFARDPAT